MTLQEAYQKFQSDEAAGRPTPSYQNISDFTWQPWMQRQVGDYVNQAGDGRYMTYDPGVSLDSPAAEEYQRQGMKTVRDVLRAYDPGFNEANWQAPGTEQNPFDRPTYLRSEQYDYSKENPETDPGAGVGSWLKAMGMAFGVAGGLAGVSSALAGQGFGAGASGFYKGITDLNPSVSDLNPSVSSISENSPYWRTLAEGGGTMSDAPSAAAGTIGEGTTGAFTGDSAAFRALVDPSSSFVQNIPGISSAAGAAALPGVSQGALTAAASSLGFSSIASALAKIPLSALVTAAASLGAGALSARAAGNASGAQVDASNAAIAEQRRQFDQTQANNAPFLATGTAANARLKALLGLDPSYTGSDAGSLTRKFTAEDMNSDPVYSSGLQFGLNEGIKGVNARAIGSGMYDSGATLKALTKFGADYASTKGNEAYQRYTADQGNIYNRLAGVSGAGQTAVNTVANAGQTATNAISNNLTDAGNARAAGVVGGANAWGGAAQGIANAANNYSSSQILDALLRRGY